MEKDILEEPLKEAAVNYKKYLEVIKNIIKIKKGK
jgi:hypothetical protein